MGSLPQTQRVAVEAFCDKDGVTRAEFIESKRRRVAEEGGPRQALGGDSPSGLQYDAEEEWDDDRLRNMGWWDHVEYATGMQEFVPTISSVPPNVVIAVAEAKRAVVLASKDMESIQAARSLKLLFFMDRLVYAQPAGMNGKKAKGKSIDMVVSGRLRQFWRGEWDAMWRAATVEGEGRGREKNAESEKTRLQANARRIDASEGKRTVQSGRVCGQGGVFGSWRGCAAATSGPVPGEVAALPPPAPARA